MITEHHYVLTVPDLARSSAFYHDVLGFEIRDLAPSWLAYVNGACRIMAEECPNAIPPRELGDHSYFAYLVVESVEGYHQRAVERGAEIVKPLNDEPWGMREFGLRTADGHRLMIGSPLGQEPGSRGHAR